MALTVHEIAEKLDSPVLLVEYLLDQYEDVDAECPFELFIAEELSEAVYLAELFQSGDEYEADARSADVFCTVCDLLDFDMEAFLG